MIELISIHLPKTAGTSFRNFLQFVFPNTVLLDYGNPHFQIQTHYRVLHGHFPVKRYSHLYPDAKYITWLRDPVERIASYYYYWKDLPLHGNMNHEHFLKSKMDLVQFAQFDPILNEFTSYFDEQELDNMFFVGITEYFYRDLFILSKNMSWRWKSLQKSNSTHRKENITAHQRSVICKFHSREIEIYQKFKLKAEKLAKKFGI